MTRFARSRGSKASNEKAPEDSTPWEVMKEQLQIAKKEKDEKKKREEAENQRIENYENFLKEQKTQKRKAVWCDFPETEENQTVSTVIKKKKENNADKNIQISENDKQNFSNPNVYDTNTSAVVEKKKKNKKNKKPQNTEDSNEISDQNVNNTSESNEIPTPKKKKKNKKNKEKETTDTKSNQIAKNGSQPTEDNSNNNTKQILNKKKKEKKLVNGKPVRRKDINDNSFQLIINGKEVELVRVDGFPVMKKDAERLHELKANMMQKGIPKSEIQRTMKLERRRAEKALARMKREVCYNCRKGGHNLSDCPDLKSKIPGVDAAEGVCFKCGSTEHRQFECKVQRDKEFRFATCFICKEPGHIARQCPDNPKGLYPNGGSCKLCGDVTHLRKDCPTVIDKKEEKSIKLSTLDSTNDLEGIGQQEITTNTQGSSKKVKKIKF